jgi:nucleotide-binding universal stress UspA family protein
MYDNILLPYDGSEGAAEVLHHAGELAHWADATIQVLYVADTARDSVTVVEGQTVDALVQQGEDLVTEAAETLDALGVSYTTDVVQGDPVETIVEYAERYDQELVVMPTHGREGISRHLLGSVSESVVRRSSVPVLTARIQPDETLVFPYESILVPTDGSSAAASAADHLVEFAASLDATVHVLSVVEDTVLASESTGDAEEAATDAAETVASDAEARGVPNVVRHVEQGTPAEVIQETVESNEIHAIGMGTTGRRDTSRILLGSVAETTVRSAPVPVMTVANRSDPGSDGRTSEER